MEYFKGIKVHLGDTITLKHIIESRYEKVNLILYGFMTCVHKALLGYTI